MHFVKTVFIALLGLGYVSTSPLRSPRYLTSPYSAMTIAAPVDAYTKAVNAPLDVADACDRIDDRRRRRDCEDARHDARNARERECRDIPRDRRPG